MTLCVFALTAACGSASPPEAPAVARVNALDATPAWTDTDGDGFPDAAELRDETSRESFRRWFTLLALAQARLDDAHRDPHWPAAQRDCAGLARYAYREALKPHSAEWLKRFKFGLPQAPPDTRLPWNYPRAPLLGAKLFRVRGDETPPQDPDSAPLPQFQAATVMTPAALDDFGTFADAATLVRHNLRRVSRDISAARPADVLVFYNPDSAAMPYHLMLFIGALPGERPDASPWLVYHTGPDTHRPASDPAAAGVVRVVQLGDLNAHPDPRWTTHRGNGRFQGVYRWRILD